MRLAEAVRFELTDGCPSLVFKTSALNHSATLPGTRYCSRFAARAENRPAGCCTSLILASWHEA